MDTVKTIQVYGTGSVSAAPDEAIIYLAVQTQDTSATTAVNENAALMAKVMQALTTLGINQSDIQTSSYTLTIQSLTSTTYPMQNIQPSSKSECDYSSICCHKRHSDNPNEHQSGWQSPGRSYERRCERSEWNNFHIHSSTDRFSPKAGDPTRNSRRSESG